MKLNLKKTITRTAGVGAGAVGSRFIGNQYAKTMNPVFKGLIHVGVGAFGPSLMKGDLIEHIGDGFIAEGALRMAESKMPAKFGVAGISDDSVGAQNSRREYVIDEDNMNGAYEDNMGGAYEDNMGAADDDSLGSDDDMAGMNDFDE